MENAISNNLDWRGVPVRATFVVQGRGISKFELEDKMRDSSGRTKRKIRWSKLYSFSCLRPPSCDSAPIQSLIGQPGFSRVVFCNEPRRHKLKPHKYPDNYVSTTKYNVVTFLPRSLFEQFLRVANLYFLLAAVLSLTSLAPFTPPSLIVPLVFVVGTSMVKEAVEDWHRFLQVTWWSSYSSLVCSHFLLSYGTSMLGNRHCDSSKMTSNM